MSDAVNMKNHLIVCADCTMGEYCAIGLEYGGEVTARYLNRVTKDNGCYIPRRMSARPLSEETSMPRKTIIHTQMRLRALLAENSITDVAVEEDGGGDTRSLRLDLGPTRSLEITGESRTDEIDITLLTRTTEPAWTEADDPEAELNKLVKGLMLDHIRYNPENGVVAFIFSGRDAPGLAFQAVGVANKIVTQREVIG